MRKQSKWIAVGLVALVAVAMVTFAAFAQTDSGAVVSESKGLLARVAANLGVSVDDLVAAFTTARLEMIDEAVAAGEITAEQAQVMKERIEAHQALREVLAAAIEDGTITRDQLALLRGQPDRGPWRMRDRMRDRRMDRDCR
ncbi:MAG: DUF2680 domain-containing protein [Candidatus Bipolaricaulis sp.]|jgi:tellurite resistance protein